MVVPSLDLKVTISSTLLWVLAVPAIGATPLMTVCALHKTLGIARSRY